MQNKKIKLIIGFVVVALVSFYGGTKYSSTQNISSTRGSFTGAQNGQFGMGGGQRSGMRGGMGGFTTGEIISKDNTSITVKLPTGGSKIIFLAGTTKVSKSVDGATTDLTTGTTVSITGTANPDGSITAESVQIRPTPPKATTPTTTQ